MLRRLAVAIAFLASVCCLPVWSAQNRDQGIELRTVQGTILGTGKAAGSPAVVYLYDDRTQSVRTHFADKTGHYRFCGLIPSDDYQIYAQRGGVTSRTHSISSQDDRRDFVVNLKIPQRD